jgi:hypothetical protein
MRGRIDVVLPSGEAGLEIVDFKSGRLRSRQHLQGNLQLPLYALAASSCGARQPANSCIPTTSCVHSTKRASSLGSGI